MRVLDQKGKGNGGMTCRHPSQCGAGMAAPETAALAAGMRR
jgi:hypothetical protein